MSHTTLNRRPAVRPASGFTLMELIVAIAIVGILSAIAFPFYQEHINKTRRAEAMAALSSAAAAFERYKASNFFSYAGACFTDEVRAGCTNRIANGNVPEDVAPPFFTLTSEVSADGRLLILNATATSVWSSRDGQLQIDNTGARRWKDKNGAVHACWPQGSSAPCGTGSLLELPD